LLGCDSITDISTVPVVDLLVKEFRSKVADARPGDVFQLGGPIRVRVLDRSIEPGAMCIAWSPPVALIGDGTRLAGIILNEVNQLPHDRAGIVIADLSSWPAFSVGLRDRGLAVARAALAKATPRADAVIVVRAQTNRDDLISFRREVLWLRPGSSNPLARALE
jgi:hypothetical protein